MITTKGITRITLVLLIARRATINYQILKRRSAIGSVRTSNYKVSENVLNSAKQAGKLMYVLFIYVKT